MQWTIPGTVLTMPCENACQIDEQLKSMFLGGGIVLSQVSGITGLEPHTVQNWVKRGFLPPPEKKRYSLRQLCRILNINMLKGIMSMEQICSLLSYVNGNLDDESDDMIDDAQLYFLFTRAAAHFHQEGGKEDTKVYLQTALQDYQEPVPGARQRVWEVLRVMLTAWFSAQLRQKAHDMVQQLQSKVTSSSM